MKPKLTIAIPAYNSEKTLDASIRSALAQEYKNKEIIVLDDGSTDRTIEIARQYPVKLIVNERNTGIGKAIERLMDEARGDYVVYLCSDDLFADPHVCWDIHSIFEENERIGVICRYYYFFMDGYTDPIGVNREKNPLVNSCCPSGIAFRKMKLHGINDIFIEMPFMVKQAIQKGWEWTMMEYDTIAARFHPGGNTGTKESYYNSSPTQNWINLTCQNYKDFPLFVQLKNRCPSMLMDEIKLHIKNDKMVLLSPKFWFYASIAIIVPTKILRKLTNWKRFHIDRHFVKITTRGDLCQKGA